MMRTEGLLLVLAGCATTDPTCFEEPPVLELGTGERGFYEVPPEGPLEVVFGPQGGYHVVFALRASGVERRVVVEATATDLETERVVTDQALRVTLGTGPDGCTHEAANQFAFLDIGRADAVVGHPGELWVQVTDGEGRAAEQTLPFTFVDELP